MSRHDGSKHYHEVKRKKMRNGIRGYETKKVKSVRELFSKRNKTKAACHKIRYKTRRDAELALSLTKGAADALNIRHESRYYHCDVCNGWHLTSMPKSVYDELTKKRKHKNANDAINKIASATIQTSPVSDDDTDMITDDADMNDDNTEVTDEYEVSENMIVPVVDYKTPDSVKNMMHAIANAGK